MKIQDIIFFIVLIFLIWRRSPRQSAIFGLLSLLVAMPLFSMWIFFTAEHLTWYASAFFLLAIVLYLWKGEKK